MVPAGNNEVPTNYVQACISIKLCSKPCDGVLPAPAPPLGRSDSTAAAARRVSLAGAGKTASIKSGADHVSGATAAAGASSTDAQQAPQQPLHAVQIKLLGLDGLQQELPAAAGNWVQTSSSQCCEYVSVPLPDLQLAVTEQRVRSWAAAAAQLQVQVTVLSQAVAADTAKKPGGAGGAGGAKNAPPAPAAAASGTLLVNCAGLLAGDTTAAYRWGKLPPATAAVQDAAGKDAAVAAGAATAGSAPTLQAPAAAAGQVERYKWHMQQPSGTLLDWLESAEVQVQLFVSPPGTAEPQQAGKAPASGAAAAKPPAPKHAGAARMSTADEAAAEHAAPSEPCSLLSPELASVLNPVVLYAYKAACLPDGPASRQQLETLCEPVKLKAVWPPMVSAPAQPAASLSAWTTLPSITGHDRDALSVRTAIFATPTIIFGADLGQQQLLQLCRCAPVQLQVRDRTALPEPAPFTAARMARQKQLAQQQQRPASGKAVKAGTAKQTPAKGAAAAKAQAAQAAAAAAATAAAYAPTASAADSAAEAGAIVVSDDGEVYASASVGLADLVKGRTGFCFNLPLQPVSTIRGGSCLDWKSRPGRYLEANSHIKGWVRCAAPLHLMHASMEEALAATAAAAAKAAAEAEAATAASSQPQAAASPAGAAAATPAASTSSSNAPVSSPRTAPKPAPAGKAAKAGASPAGVRAPSAAPVNAPANADAPSAAAAEQQGVGDAGEGAQPAGAEPDKLPQPSAHVMLPSEVRYKGTMTRAVFRMDYRDSDLLHVLEDSVRQHNAIVLGLAPPPPPTPEELAAIKAAEEAAAAAALAAAEAAAAAAAGSQRGRSRPSSSMAGKAFPRASLASASKAGAAGKAAAAAAAPQAVSAAAAAAVSAAGSTAAAALAGRASEAGALDPALASKAAARRASAAGTTASGTPRSILKQPQQLSAAGGLSPLGPGLAAEPSTLTSGMASSRQHQQGQHGQQHPRASFAGDLESCGPVRSTNRGIAGRVGDESDSDEGDGSDQELSEADLRLQAALQRYDHVDLDQRLLQALSTYQLSPEQVSDDSLDVLTGYHLVDGDLRLFVLEGPAEGKGMQHLVTAVARWALEDQEDEQRFEAEEAAKGGSQEQEQQQQQQEQEKKRLPRNVLFNTSIRYPARMYGSLGVDLWMLKLHSSLSMLGGTARTFTGHVRPQCIAGMKCLLGMVQGYVTAPAIASSSNSNSPTRTAASSGRGSATTAAVQPPAAPKPAGGVVLMRQLDQYNLFPTAEQLHLVDKKFGGELTKADVLGVEAEEDFSDDEDEPDLQQSAQHITAGSTTGKPQGKAAQPELTGSHAAAAAAKAASAKLQQLLADSTEMGSVPAAVAGAAAAKSLKSRRSSRRSGKGSRSRSRSRRRGRRSSTSSKKKRAFRPKHALDMDNSVYLHLRMEAHRRRVQRDIMAEHMQALTSLSASKQPLREAWATWNPQRAAARELQQQIEEGKLTLEDTIKAYRDATSPVPPPDASHLDPEQAKTLGWYPHGKPWMWPAPRDPATYNMHPLKPSEFRVEELQEAWQEGGLAAAAAAAQASSKDGAATNSAGVVFDPLVRPRPHGLFTQDPEFWQTVHLGGDGWEEHLAQQAAAAKAEWADKVVVKDIHFHALPGTEKAAAQADRMTNILKGKPVKKGLKVAHTPPPPVSMYIETPWQPPAAGVGAGSLGSGAASTDKTKWMGKDFDALCNKQRSVVAKTGFSDATTAALHDKASP